MSAQTQTFSCYVIISIPFFVYSISIGILIQIYDVKYKFDNQNMNYKNSKSLVGNFVESKSNQEYQVLLIQIQYKDCR